MRLASCQPGLVDNVSPAAAPAGVVLLHGLARTRLSMRTLAASLCRAGYQVDNPGYPSRRHAIETLARLVIPPAVARLRRRGAATIHFVTHSMGGILVRSFLAEAPPPELGRVVMLAPPNQGSEVVDWLGRYPWFHRVFGPAAGELSTGADSLPCRLGPADFPLGILIGDRGAHWPLARCFTGANDGKVAVARARLEGMADFRVVDCGHAFIMRDRRVQELVVRFLRAGEFGADDGL